MPGKSKIQDHLDDLAQRHPEFAEQLKGWSDLERKPEGFERQEEEEKREEPGPLRSGNLRNTVPDMQASQSLDETDRGQRSQSAPPEAKHGPSGQFVSKVDISGKEDKQNVPSASQESSPAPPPQPQQKVFHIPIYVEGRDEPILPKEATEGNTPCKQNRKPMNTTGGKNHRIPVIHETKKDAQPQTQSKPQPQPQQSPPPPPPPPPPTAQQQPPEQPVSKDPLSQVALVQKEVDALKERVSAFKGQSKSDKEYIYLDEMLTRNLLKLDNIDTEGKEEVRTARKEVIKRIQECISQLEAAPTINSSALVPVNEEPPCKTEEVSSTTTDSPQEKMEVSESNSAS
ncbi:hypothetical protein O3M35_006185 [Rhynocoris fuscipes]